MPANGLGERLHVTLALFAAICVLCAELGQFMAVPGAAVFPVFAPVTGILVAALVVTERRQWMAAAAVACGAMLASDVVHARPLVPSLVAAVVAGLEGAVVASLVQRRTGRDFSLDTLPHTWTLVACATAVPMVGGALWAGSMWLAGFSYLAQWRAWWLSESLGVVVAAPLLLAIVAKRHQWRTIVRSWKALEIALVLIGAGVMSIGIFGGVFDPVMRVPAFILPFLIWPCFRVGPGGLSASLFVISLVGLSHAVHGTGPFAFVDATPDSLVLRSQEAMASAAVSFLLLASLVGERRQVAAERAVLVSDLQQALAEIKTLRGFIHICAWCNQVQDDAGYWQRIDMYLDQRTDATFSHSICPACAAGAHGEIDSHRRAAERVLAGV